MKAYIKGISFYLPEQIVTNDDLLELFPEWDSTKVFNKVGVKSRHIAKADETAADLAERAARKLFEEYNIKPSNIDFILLCTQSPDYRLPSTACILQDRLGIPTSSGAFDYNLGCSGCIYGMGVAKGLIMAGLAQNVLLITSETYSKYIYPADISNKTIFGDGAAACLISSEGGLMEVGDFVFGTDGSGAENLILRSGGAKNPINTGNSKTDDDGHIAYDDYLYMNGSAIFNFTLDTVPAMVSKILDKCEKRMEDIDYFVFHQANKYMLSTIRKICGIDKDKFYIDLEERGNTVSSTILIGLKECLNEGIIHKGMTVMIAGFGVGLSYGATILKL